MVDNLWQCLSYPLRMEVTSEQGANLENALEAGLIEAIKRMPVLESNPMVHHKNMRRLCREKVRRLGTSWLS